MSSRRRRVLSLQTLPCNAHRRLAGYLRGAAASTQPSTHQAHLITHWVAQLAERLRLDLPASFIREWAHPDDEARPTTAAWRRLRETLEAVPEPTRAQRPFGRLARLLGLDELEEQILTLTADYATLKVVENLWDALAGSFDEEPRLIANSPLFPMLLNVEPRQVAKRLRPDAMLRSAGLLLKDHCNGLDVLRALLTLIWEPRAPADLRAALLGPVAKAPLPFAAFAHLGPEVEHVRAMLRGAVAERAAGVHVLLYGPPGTGKTTFAAALAAEAAVPIYEVGLEGPEGEELERHQRVAALRIAQRLLGGGAPAMLLLDEAEDLFSADLSPFGHGRLAGSRAHVHRLIETAPVPVIWTANDITSFGPAVLRRMACCIELRIPPAPVRERLWREAAKAEGITLPAGEAAGLARLLPASPALAHSAMRAARLAGGDAETVRWAVSGVARAMAGGQRPAPDGTGEAFDLALVSADCDLTALVARLTRQGATQRISLLLSGPPGSGKSAFARHLAEAMGLPVLQKRASDLISPYLGETEQRIAGAFHEARDGGAFLIFDEADSLLGDRSLALRSWEISQVNEMLTWMERHPLPFCCTTNLPERLDPASQRRFLVKARFSFLDAAQAALAWRRSFGTPAPAGLARLDRLTPADFDLVRRMAQVAGTLADAVALLTALDREQQAKPGTTAPIGFLPARAA